MESRVWKWVGGGLLLAVFGAAVVATFDDAPPGSSKPAASASAKPKRRGFQTRDELLGFCAENPDTYLGCAGTTPQFSVSGSSYQCSAITVEESSRKPGMFMMLDAVFGDPSGYCLPLGRPKPKATVTSVPIDP